MRVPLSESSYTPTIRVATAADIPAMTAIINQAFALEKSFISGDRTSHADLAEHMATGPFLVLEESGELVGCVWTEPRGERGYIGMLAIRVDRQGCGFGRRLMTAAEEALREQGCIWADICVVSLRTELLPLYRGWGYAESGVVESPTDFLERLLRPAHLIRMSKPL